MTLPMPKHIALILDGNGRWATSRGLPRTAGHEHGASAVRKAVYGCHERGVSTVTLYAFSAANWSRPRNEIDTLMRLCAEFATNELAELKRRGVRVIVIGDLDELPTPTRRATEELLEATRDGKSMTLGARALPTAAGKTWSAPSGRSPSARALVSSSRRK